MPEACHRQLAKLTGITHGLCARGFLLFWPRLPLCPWASHPEPDRSILYLEVIILMANTRDKPDNHSLSVCFNITETPRGSHSQHDNGTRRCIPLPGRNCRSQDSWWREGSSHVTGSKQSHHSSLNYITYVFPTSLLVTGFPD